MPDTADGDKLEPIPNLRKGRDGSSYAFAFGWLETSVKMFLEGHVDTEYLRNDLARIQQELRKSG